MCRMSAIRRIRMAYFWRAIDPRRLECEHEDDDRWREEGDSCDPEAIYTSGFHDAPLPVITVEVNNGTKRRTYKLLIDTGASIDIASERVAKEFPNQVSKTHRALKIKVANG